MDNPPEKLTSTMSEDERRRIIDIVLARETLRPLSRLGRLFRAPLRTIPYYIIATASHIHPFPFTFPTLWGTRMTAYLPEGNTFPYYGFCEANVTNFFLRYVREGMTIIDIGAHVGIYTMLASHLIGSGRVYSFEPTPHTFRLLARNTHDLQNVSLENRALADREGEIRFADYGPGFGAYNSASGAGGQGITKSAHMVTVPATTLDAYCATHTLHPSLIKLDAEGFESAVLRGARKTLTDRSTKRPLLILEVAGGAEWAANRADSFSLLESFEYVPHAIRPDGLLEAHELKATYIYDNLLFIPAERTHEEPWTPSKN